MALSATFTRPITQSRRSQRISSTRLLAFGLCPSSALSTVTLSLSAESAPTASPRCRLRARQLASPGGFGAGTGRLPVTRSRRNGQCGGWRVERVMEGR